MVLLVSRKVRSTEYPVGVGVRVLERARLEVSADADHWGGEGGRGRGNIAPTHHAPPASSLPSSPLVHGPLATVQP